MALIDIIIVAVFLALMFAAGLMVSRWIKDAEDFYVASRELTPFILAATITATNVNMYSFIGQAGQAYKSGLGIIWNTWVGNMALVFSGIFVVPIMRRLMLRTVPEFLEMRYNKWLRLFVGFVWAVRLCMWLAVILMAATTAAQVITGIHNPWIWFAAFAIIAIVYSAVGGAWAVALTDTIQFVIMLAGALIVLPIAMSKVGWMPGLVETLRTTGRADHLKLVTRAQEFNWLFIISMILLSTKWACIDQGILQRAFGARNPRTVAKGMVLSGIITTPFAFLWILPGLANAVLLNVDKPDAAMPTFLATYLPAGILGLVMCGLIASQLSTISADINSIATLFTNDVYNNLNRKATPKQLLRVVRASTVVAGFLMIFFAYYIVQQFKSVVDANLTIVALVDMPIFVIAIVFGLLSRRANWQGATAGLILGSTAGLLTYRYFRGNPDLSSFAFLTTLFGENPKWDALAKHFATIASTTATLIITPVVSLLFPRPAATPQFNKIYDAFAAAKSDTGGEIHLWPVTTRGKSGLVLMAIGFAVFLAGVLSGSVGFAYADAAAVLGMLTFFSGGLVRIYSD